MEVTRVFDILDRLNAKFQKEDLLCSKENKQWKKNSTKDFLLYVNQVSNALLESGIKRGDKVAIVSNNRPEWNFVDYGCQQIDVVTVPIFPTISLADLKYILIESDVKMVFISGKDIYKKLALIEAEIPHVQSVVSFNPVDGIPHFDQFLEKGKSLSHQSEVEAIRTTIKPDDLFTILYTSGTTGFPKGVMLSHSNLVSNVISTRDMAPFASSWRALSFLPLNHVYERMVNTLYLYHGISIYYAEGLETIGDNLKEVCPQVFVSVPRLIERVYDRLLSAGEKLTGWKKKLFFNAVDLALTYDPRSISFGAKLKRKFHDVLIFSKWRQALGGNVVCMVSGGAALQPRLARVFQCAGILILEGYGLTETSPVISANCFLEDGICIGTVGLVIEGTTVKIADDGEILVKGPGVMLGYYKNENATREVIDEEGWFHTGDIGTFVEGRFLKITDRKKEIFKTSSGKYIAPLMIENKIKECRFVEQCCVVGEGEKFASALIVLSMDYVKEWCQKNQHDIPTPEAAVSHEGIRKEVSSFIREMNKSLAPYEQIKKQELISVPWTVEGGEMTPKLSMKRKVILKKHESELNRIFGGASSDEN